MSLSTGHKFETDKCSVRLPRKTSLWVAVLSAGNTEEEWVLGDLGFFGFVLFLQSYLDLLI